jgi:hypothetical protein
MNRKFSSEGSQSLTRFRPSDPLTRRGIEETTPEHFEFPATGGVLAFASDASSGRPHERNALAPPVDDRAFPKALPGSPN